MVTLALIGVGRWGQNYLKTVPQLTNIQIKYVCTRHLASLVNLPNIYQKLTHFRDIFRFTDIDGVIIATPAATHFQISRVLLKQGYNLLIEKPLALNPVQAHQLLRIWQKRPSVVMVGHTQLYNPAYLKCKKLLPVIGVVKKISFSGLSSHPRTDTSVLWDWGPHPASIFLDLNDFPVKKITSSASKSSSQGNLIDTITSKIRFNNQVQAEMNIGWYNPEKVRKLIIRGLLGTIVLDDTKSENKISLKMTNLNIEYPAYEPQLPLEIELKEFVKAIKLNTKTASGLVFGAKVVELLSNIESTLD